MSSTPSIRTISSLPTAGKAKTVWCETQWVHLSFQAKHQTSPALPTVPYFDPKTMLLSKEVNSRLWKLLGKLYDNFGAEKAPYACPVMLPGGEIEWHSFLGEDKGSTVQVLEEWSDELGNF